MVRKHAKRELAIKKKACKEKNSDEKRDLVMKRENQQ